MARILDTPITINQMTLPNRLVMPPMATAKSGADGQVTDALCDYYREKSRGGYIGLIVTEHSFISPEGKASRAQLSIADDSAIPGLSRIVDAIHQNGTKVMAQINHAGGFTAPAITGMKTMSASAVRAPGLSEAYPTPKEISVPVILTGGVATAEAAERLLETKKADLIGVGRAILRDSDWARRAMTEEKAP